MKKTATILASLFVVTAVLCFQAIGAGNQQFCNNYADTAVKQYNLGKQHNLPGIVPPAWSGNRDGHYNWCMMAPEKIANSEKAKRQAYLDKNIPKKKSDAPIVNGALLGTMAAPKMMTTIGTVLGDTPYLGCFKDQKTRDLSGYSFNSPKMTKNLCLDTCRQKGFKYAGLQYSQYCFCGNSYGRLGKADNCNMPCSGNENEMCGGGWANSVFSINNSSENEGSVAIANPHDANFNGQIKALQKFNQLKKISRAKDPIVPVFIHTLEKLLSGATDFSEIEQIMLRGVKVLSPVRKQQLINKWQQIPLALRMSETPRSLQNLSPKSKVSMSSFTNALIESSKTIYTDKKPSSGLQHTSFDIDALNHAGIVYNAPQITNFAPMGPDGPFVRIGQDFVLYGNRFGNDKSKVKIHFLQYRNGKYVPVASIYPQSISETQIRSLAIAPNLSGNSNRATRIIVEVDKKYSSPYNIIVGPDVNPIPVISKVEPSAVYPGKNVLVSGKNFKRPLNLFIQSLNQKTSEFRKSGFNFYVKPTVLSQNQFEFEIPQKSWSGHYRFNIQSGNSGYSGFSLLDVLPTSYKVQYKKIHCIDESNEWSASDEIVVAWIMIVDNTAWSKGSSEYSDFDQGENKEFTSTDSAVIPAPGNDWQTVKDFLYFKTTLYEWDKGDMESYTEGIKAVGEVAPGVGAAIGAAFGSPEAGKKVGEIVKVVGDGLAKLIDWIGNDNDLLGSDDRYYTAPQLQQLTAKQSIIPDAHAFMNDNATGSYIVHFNIIRNDSGER